MTGKQGDRRTGIPIPGKEALTRPKVKRFYADVDVVPAEHGGYLVRLDGRTIRTPAKRPFVVPTEPLAAAIRDEWSAQAETVDPGSMPNTRLANTVIDAVATQAEAVRADIVAFAASDLLCYRASHPKELVECQRAHWDPVLAWAARVHAIRLTVVEGLMPVGQPAAALARVAALVDGYDLFRLASLHVVTTLAGSAILALALLEGQLSADAAWGAAHVDEDHQISLWGEDAEAAARRQLRRREFDAAVRFAALAGPG